MRVNLIIIVGLVVVGCQQDAQSQQKQSSDPVAENVNGSVGQEADEFEFSRVQDQVWTGRYTAITRAVEMASPADTRAEIGWVISRSS